MKRHGSEKCNELAFIINGGIDESSGTRVRGFWLRVINDIIKARRRVQASRYRSLYCNRGNKSVVERNNMRAETE